MRVQRFILMFIKTLNISLLKKIQTMVICKPLLKSNEEDMIAFLPKNSVNFLPCLGFRIINT